VVIAVVVIAGDSDSGVDDSGDFGDCVGKVDAFGGYEGDGGNSGSGNFGDSGDGDAGSLEASVR